MTPDPPPVPNWQSLAWAEHVTQAVAHWCVSCQSFLVPREGASCPCCDGAATYEATA